MRLHLGCGTTILPDCINVDIVPLPGVDVAHNLDETPWPWEDNSVTNILAMHLFEHLNNPIGFMTESHRVMAVGGILAIEVPYYKSEAAFTDPTHKRFCTEFTWDYWIDGTPLNKVFGPAYNSPPAIFKLNFREVENNETLRIILEKK